MTGENVKKRGWLSTVLTYLILPGLLLIIVIVFLPIVQFNSFSNQFIEPFATQTGIDINLVKAIGILLFIPWFIGTGFAIKIWNQNKRLKGIIIMLVILAIYNFSLYMVTKDYYFNKCYAETHTGIEIYQCNDLMKEPVYGYDLKPITVEVLPEVLSGLNGCNRLNPNNSDIDFFYYTGEAKVWYLERNDGQYEFFDSNCHHPQLGIPLNPITSEIVEDWEKKTQDKSRIENKNGISSPNLSQQENSPNESDSAIDIESSNTTTLKESQTKQSNTESKDIESENVDNNEWQKYLNISAIKMLGNNGKIIVVENEDPDGQTGFNLTSFLRNNGVNAESNILSRNFFRDGLANRVKEGDYQLLQKLKLSNYADHVVFFNLSINEPIKNELYVLRGTLNIWLVPTTGGKIRREQLSSRGSGFTLSNAREQFYNRIKNELSHSNILTQLEYR